MKKILLLLLIPLALMGCEKKESVDIIAKIEKNISKSNSYELSGKLTIFDNEDNYNYDIKVSYLKGDYYNVKMNNLSNNHEQLIIKNDEGLYVITPSLNRSYKFDSNWPNNSSQIYILSSLSKDIKQADTKVEINDDKYIIISKVNYPNNTELSYEKITINKNEKIENIKVYDENDNVRIELQITNINLKANIDKNIFKLENYIENSDCEDSECRQNENVSKLENAIYPVYVPSNTYLSSSEIIDDTDDNRIILTFSGEKNYVLVEENAISLLDHEIIPIYGEPVLINDTIGALSTNAIYWTSNNINYYLASNDLTSNEMLSIASSLTNYKTAMYTK